MIKTTASKVIFSMVFIAGLALNGQLLAETVEADPHTSGKMFHPSDDVMADLNTLMNTAKESHKLALVVMGANWCHDSRGLASRLYLEPLQSLVNEKYETLFVDVGFLNKGENVIKSLGPPVYWATPTVLIIDPESGRLINAENRHQWANAYNISMTESVYYFQQMAENSQAPGGGEVSTELQHLMSEIDSFEQQQADRLYSAYALLGPQLEVYKNGDESAFPEEQWGEVRAFRYKAPYDIDALREDARRRVAAGEQNILLSFPEYPPFSWEVD